MFLYLQTQCANYNLQNNKLVLSRNPTRPRGLNTPVESVPSRTEQLPESKMATEDDSDIEILDEWPFDVVSDIFAGLHLPGNPLDVSAAYGPMPKKRKIADL